MALRLALAGLLAALPASTPAQPLDTGLGVLDAGERIPFFIEDGRRVRGFERSDVELARLALDAWSRASDGVLTFTEAPGPDTALVQLQWVSAGDGLFGQTQRLYVSGQAAARVFVIPDVASLEQPLARHASQDTLLRDAIVYLTCLHELGHAIGLPHTDDFDDVMYWFGYGGSLMEYFLRYRLRLRSRADIAAHSGLSPGDIAALRALYP